MANSASRTLAIIWAVMGGALLLFALGFWAGSGEIAPGWGKFSLQYGLMLCGLSLLSAIFYWGTLAGRRNG